CWRKAVPIQRVGLYIPGGSAPLFSTLLMLAIPAQIAGCTDICVFTPAGENGKVNDAILYCASLLGLEKIYSVGGVQAIGAMAYGTSSIGAVNKIFGPGNQYVTCAKQLVSRWGVAIDMPAGPSEVAIYADESSVPAFIAADLLSQAEHGKDSQVLLVCSSQEIITNVQAEIAKQLKLLPRADTALAALRHSNIIVLQDPATAFDLLNTYAPEHLIIASARAAELSEGVINAGSVFLGNYSPEAAGDYASGTNHTLPTNGYAAAYSGVSVDSFVKKITFQELSKEGLLAISGAVETMAAAEGLTAHKNAISIRLKEQQ
ncbi:MAG: histidinol dehydrogenase, partial [Chitinophagaceae bacterium]